MKRQDLAGTPRPWPTTIAGAGTVLRALLPGCLVLAVCLLVAGCGTSPAASPSVSSATTSVPATDVPSAGATPAGGGGTAAPDGQASRPAAVGAHAASGLGSLRKVVIIMEENHSLQQAFPSGMPYLWSLARQYGYATDWSDIGHPSLPNYLAIFAGSAFNEPQDCAPESGCTYPGLTVFGQALALGETAKAYEESMPQPCATGYAGEYDVNHNPWAYFPSEAAGCRANDVPAGTPDSGALTSDVRDGKLPTVGLITPNLIHDGHNGTLAQADAWLRSWIPVLISGPDWRGGRLAIVVVFDEGETTEQVPAVFMAPGLSGATVSAPTNQYALTRLIDEFIGARPLRQAGNAANVAHSLGLGR